MKRYNASMADEAWALVKRVGRMVEERTEGEFCKDFGVAWEATTEAVWGLSGPSYDYDMTGGWCYTGWLNLEGGKFVSMCSEGATLYEAPQDLFSNYPKERDAICVECRMSGVDPDPDLSNWSVQDLHQIFGAFGDDYVIEHAFSWEPES